MLKPQLAVDVNENCEGMRFPVWGFIKADGVRGCHLTGSFTGRSLKPLDNIALTKKYSHMAYEGFDGELTVDGELRGAELCNRTGSVVRKRDGGTNVVWNLFDYLHPSVVGLKYKDRYAALVEAASRVTGVYVLPYQIINNVAEAMAFIEWCSDNGYEGAIFRDPEALHKSGRATASKNDFWRWKPTSDKDALVIGYEEALENQNETKVNALGRTERSSHKANKVGKGMVGVLICQDLLTNEVIRVGPGKSTHKQRVDWFNNPTLIVGHYIKYTSLDTGVKDAPRQARYSAHRPAADVLKAA